MMGVFGMIRKARAKAKAEARGIDPNKFDKYWDEKEKKIGMLELQKSREIEERKIKERLEMKATRGARFKKALRKGITDYKKGRSKIKPKFQGSFTGPQLGLNKDSSDVKVKKGTW